MRTNSELHRRVKELLDPFDNCAVECDGMTRIAATVLDQVGIDFLVFFGSLTYTPDNKVIEPHFWLELQEDGSIVDYRARMWLGQSENIPHGVFFDDAYPLVEYDGEPTHLSSLMPVTLEMLTS